MYTNVNNSPQFGARVNFTCTRGLLSEEQARQIVNRAKHIGHSKNVFNITVSGTAENYSIKENHKLYSSTFAQPLCLYSERSYNKYAKGDVMAACLHVIDKLKDRANYLGLY